MRDEMNNIKQKFITAIFFIVLFAIIIFSRVAMYNYCITGGTEPNACLLIALGK